MKAKINLVDLAGSSKRADPYSEADYLVTDGIRSVVPYVHEFTTHAKGRWVGREIRKITEKKKNISEYNANYLFLLPTSFK